MPQPKQNCERQSRHARPTALSASWTQARIVPGGFDDVLTTSVNTDSQQHPAAREALIQAAPLALIERRLSVWFRLPPNLARPGAIPRDAHAVRLAGGASFQVRVRSLESARSPGEKQRKQTRRVGPCGMGGSSLPIHHGEARVSCSWPPEDAPLPALLAARLRVDLFPELMPGIVKQGLQYLRGEGEPKNGVPTEIIL